MNWKAFAHRDWTQIWAGGWSLLTCSHFGDQYTQQIRFGGKPFLTQAVIFVRQGKSSCWVRQRDKDMLGKYLASQVRRRSRRAVEIGADLQRAANAILAFIDRHIDRGVDASVYQRFWEQVLAYYRPHISVKYVVDYLEPKLLKRTLPHFEAARIYAEQVFKRTEEFVEAVAKIAAKRTGIPPPLILCCTKGEFLHFLAGEALPATSTLAERNNNCALLFTARIAAVATGDEFRRVEKMVFAAAVRETLKGVTAFAGKVRGRVRVVLDPAHVRGFRSGDILVAGMTRPEYLPLMKRAAAFVTDAGGILSHAAITARELKKPCVIDTKIATQVFKDGDFVEVDADHGVVKVLERTSTRSDHQDKVHHRENRPR